MDLHQKPELLNSWKEIACYLGRGVRTVQRWEQIGLPVRRIGQSPRAPVIATTAEMDGWLRTAHQHRFEPSQSIEVQRYHPDLQDSINQSRALRVEAELARREHRKCVEDLQRTISTLCRIS